MTMMLGKELLSGLWVRPECSSYCCHCHFRSCLTFLSHRFFVSHHSRCDPAFFFPSNAFMAFARSLHTLVATRRRRCLLRSAWVNVMPEWLLSVISAILAGGIPGFRIELCCFFSSSVVDVALKARFLHEHKLDRHLYKDKSCPFEQANR